MPSLVLREHLVPHVSKIPANYGDAVKLPVREYDGTHGSTPRKPVLMLHGRSVPALAGFDLAPVPEGHATRYSWAQELAQDGYDVFLMDLQGSGRSPRPRVMDEPCNANPKQQQSVLVPHRSRNPAPSSPRTRTSWATRRARPRSSRRWSGSSGPCPGWTSRSGSSAGPRAHS